MKGLTRRQASSDATRPARQNLVERRFQIGQHAIGGRAPPPHGIGILAVEGGEVWLGASTGAPPPRPLGNSPMPVGESLGGELADFEFAKRPENVLPRHAFDAVGGLAAADNPRDNPPSPGLRYRVQWAPAGRDRKRAAVAAGTKRAPHVAPEKSRSRRRRWRLGDHRPGRAWSSR